jgi:hypothetical protein
MAAKRSSCRGTILTTLFSTVIAPILVGIVTAELRMNAEKSAAAETPTVAAQMVRADAGRASERTQIVAEGVGWSPDEAVQDALRKALRDAAAAQVEPAAWARNGTALFEALLRSSHGLILRYRVLHSGKAWDGGREYYYTTLAVDVARRELGERLRGVGAAQ